MADAEPNIRKRTRPAEPRRYPRSKDADNGVMAKLKEYVNTNALQDPWEGQYALQAASSLTIIQPPYNPHTLARLPYENSTLLQCIEAMVRNCEGHGWQLEYVGPDDQKDSEAALAEKKLLEKLFNYPNDVMSFQEMRERLRFDYESQGNCYMEVGRDRSGRVTMLAHIPAQTMRRTSRDRQETEVEVKLPRDGSDTSRVKKRFCRFVQQVGERKIWFKEYGDPRVIDPATGLENPNLSPEEGATEIIHRCLYHPASPYGVPRWINQLPSILGSRQAELTNYDFFKDNGIPAMAVLVAGGALTQESMDNIESQFTAIKGREAVHRLVFIEAQGNEDLASTDGAVPVPKVEIKPLRGEQQNDAMFQGYEKDCTEKIRSSFRLPPLFIGLHEDLNYATAKTSYSVAEGQVFAPERKSFDEDIDRKVLSTYDAKFWSFRSQPSKLTDGDEVVKALKEFDAMGALTPNTAISLANQYFDLELPTIEDEWGNWPFSIVRSVAAKGALKGLDDIMERLDAEIDPATGQPRPKPQEKKPEEATPGKPKAPKVVGTATPKPDVKEETKLAVAEVLVTLRDTLKAAA